VMRIKSFEVSDFRKFDRPVRLEGMGDGINVLAEPNEFGKSTLLAALKAVLFEQHRVGGNVGKRMRHAQNATSPVLGLNFEVDGGLHRIEKRFMHREPYARLTLPDGTRIESDAAEERLREILGFGIPGKMGATPDSLGLWGALWVTQQEALRQPDLPATGHATLHACLEAELGTLAGGDRSGALSAQVRAELSGLLDGFNRPKGRFKEVGEQVTSIDGTLVQLRAKRINLEEAIGESARKGRELADASDADEDQQIADDLDDARRRRDDALQHQHVLQGAVANLSLAERHHNDAVEETGRRTARRQKIAAARVALDMARDGEARLLEEQVAAEVLLTQRRDMVRSAEDAVATAAQALKAANAVSALVMRSEQIVRLDATLRRATEAQAEINQLSGELSANPADAARLEAVMAAVGTLDRERSMLDAQATEIAFQLEPGAAGRVEVAGTGLPTGTTLLRVVEDTAIDIAGIGRVRVRPAIRNREMLLDAVKAAESAMTAALRAVGASDPAEAAALGAVRSGIADRLRVAEAALKSETPGETTVGLKPGLEALRNHVEAGRSRLAAELAALGLAALPTMLEADTSLDANKNNDEAATDALAEARTALVAPEAEHGRAVSVQRDAVTAAGKARSDLANLEQEVDAALAAEADTALAARLVAAHADLVGRRELVVQTQRDAPAGTVEDMNARIKRLESAGKSRFETARQLREEMAGLTACIRFEEGEGLDEQIADLERRRTDLAAEQAALERDVAVLTLLRDTLAKAEQEARERYVAPVVRRMTPYLQGLFPGVEVALGDKLQITGLTRQAGAEDIERLSDGTVEQVAVLLRLAYADLLVERGKPAMLILDDALAYSDRNRLELIFDTLTRAAERMQILVLTCRVDAFSRLGGNRLRLVDA
jgi:energy-coupling factor transporter ATP-binding protein EcfA2